MKRYLVRWTNVGRPNVNYWLPLTATSTLPQTDTALTPSRRQAMAVDKRQADHVASYWGPREAYYLVSVEEA